MPSVIRWSASSRSPLISLIRSATEPGPHCPKRLKLDEILGCGDNQLSSCLHHRLTDGHTVAPGVAMMVWINLEFGDFGAVTTVSLKNQPGVLFQQHRPLSHPSGLFFQAHRRARQSLETERTSAG